MMGGDITVTSDPGKGSTFTFTFCAQEAAAATSSPGLSLSRAAEPARKSLRGLRVLLTGDNAINRQVIKLFLAPQGCDIVEAANGKEALDLLARYSFDIVLPDVHMPVIALTADAMSGDRKR